MSDQNPYEQLGVSEDASFEEIQNHRTRLLEQYNGDVKRLEVIEIAYDAILMDRLRMRQEGKIKVPERIRFPERLVQSAPQESLPRHEQSSKWFARMLDKPTTGDVVLPLVWYLGLSAIALFYRAGGDQALQLALVVGVGVSVFFLNRKENSLGRSVLWTFSGLVIGLVAGGLLVSFLPQVALLHISGNQFSTVFTFILLWVITSFFR
ncbi:CPP1-like family protein [Calothrix sp. UHCC 0171]|uniref:CPP1-like family protein n=1 Tax=Calothrix sp. UHCC 0171 TaxID=3110245 RepID=UPI002B21AB8C|nr:CPP1-like family protein [Calothrix sp. UHCC 0171]MEA5570818.1 CPP1-like family protein [Calothrix sp. UHCC 0171]